MQKSDVIIIGAGAAGMMCAWQAALRGRSVVIIEHTRKVGEKIRISGGGRANFTNLYCSPDNFLSQNPHFCKSALRRFDQHDFIAMIEDHGIAYHEKAYDEKSGNQNARGQLFCDHSAQDIISMLRDGITNAGGHFQMETKVKHVQKEDDAYIINTDKGDFSCESLVIACGGLSIPKIGASNFGYELAKTFGLNIIRPRAGLVPLTFDDDLLAVTKELSGVSVDAHVTCGDGSFREGLLFTHRGLSGPSILQVSSYWREGERVSVNLAPEIDAFDRLKSARTEQPKQMLRTILSSILPTRIASMVAGMSGCDTRIADLSDKKLRIVSNIVNEWQCKPKGSEGYRTAEVTLGGVDTDEISSKTFEAKKEKGLYFIGEVLDVTGHLGGHNFQWAWSSGWCCGQVI
ncbi:MAG: aminoacetone oxidase family FAD-binding enzyme [Zetaproteobacteria bacterium]|nr:MAG: aminoacetone oxidase family FAD-binding enzyme [Zetaproteobacteria bacterium]